MLTIKNPHATAGLNVRPLVYTLLWRPVISLSKQVDNLNDNTESIR